MRLQNQADAATFQEGVESSIFNLVPHHGNCRPHGYLIFQVAEPSVSFLLVSSDSSYYLQLVFSSSRALSRTEPKLTAATQRYEF